MSSGELARRRARPDAERAKQTKTLLAVDHDVWSVPSSVCDASWYHIAYRFADGQVKMITHNTLYNLANSLGMLAMFTVVLYHFVAVNARHLQARTNNVAGSSH